MGGVWFMLPKVRDAGSGQANGLPGWPLGGQATGLPDPSLVKPMTVPRTMSVHGAA